MLQRRWLAPEALFRRAPPDHGFSIARHAAQIGSQFFEKFALLPIGRQSADEVAILGFGEQLFQFFPEVLHASELPPETAGESSQVNTRLKFKKRTGTTLPDRDQTTGFSGGPVQF